jgi:hypothetical protein
MENINYLLFYAVICLVFQISGTFSFLDIDFRSVILRGKLWTFDFFFCSFISIFSGCLILCCSVNVTQILCFFIVILRGMIFFLSLLAFSCLLLFLFSFEIFLHVLAKQFSVLLLPS